MFKQYIFRLSWETSNLENYHQISMFCAKSVPAMTTASGLKSFLRSFSPTRPRGSSLLLMTSQSPAFPTRLSSNIVYMTSTQAANSGSLVDGDSQAPVDDSQAPVVVDGDSQAPRRSEPWTPRRSTPLLRSELSADTLPSGSPGGPPAAGADDPDILPGPLGASQIIGTVRRAKSFDLRNLSLLEMRRVMTLRHPGMNGPNADLIMTVDSVDEVGYGGHVNGRFTNPFLGTTWTFRFPMRYLQMTGQEARAFGPFGDRDIHPLPLSRSRSRSPPSHWRRSDSAETVNASPEVKKEHKSESE